MKRFIALLLILILALSFCACGNEKASNKEDFSGAKKYVGTTWVSSDIHTNLYSFRLLPEGKVIWNEGAHYSDQEAPDLITDEIHSEGGEWLFDDERIIIFYFSSVSGSGGYHAYILHIDGDTLLYHDSVFTKVE